MAKPATPAVRSVVSLCELFPFASCFPLRDSSTAQPGFVSLLPGRASLCNGVLDHGAITREGEKGAPPSHPHFCYGRLCGTLVSITSTRWRVGEGHAKRENDCLMIRKSWQRRSNTWGGGGRGGKKRGGLKPTDVSARSL